MRGVSIKRCVMDLEGADTLFDDELVDLDVHGFA